MEIKLITGATTFEAAVNTIKKIDVAAFDRDNLVVVPDSFSMQAENLIFDTLKIKSTFNIEVVGISRLAAKLLQKANVNYQRLSGLEEIFNIYKAVKACEGQFVYFKKCDVDFCIKILQIIKQFKGCKITPERIKTVGDENLDNKMHDLKLIYIKFEELLGDKLDLSKLLEFFSENVDKLDLSTTNLYFINFDSFSMEINSFICKLAKSFNQIFIGMAKPLSAANAFIYEDDILKKTTALAKQFSVPVKVENFPTALQAESLQIVKNLFAFEIPQGQSDFFSNVLAKNMFDEVDFVAKTIRHEVIAGKSFKDFAVAVSDKKYFDLIKDRFSFYEIAHYCDDAVDLTQTILGRFLLQLLKIAKLGFVLSDFQFIASSPLIEPDDQALKEIEFFKVEEVDEFLKRFPKYEKIVSQIKQLALCKKLQDFVGVFKQIMLDVEQKHQQILEKIAEKGVFKKQSENLQALALILSVLEKFSQLGAQEEFLISDFENLLTLALKSVKVETIPSYIDAVYVGDATDSYFEHVDTLFVLGATAGVLPRQRNDIGLIDDDDIKKMSLNFVLEPEIKVINRRNRLKLFELLQHAQKKLIVCSPVNVDGRQSEVAGFVTDLQKLFGKNTFHTVSMEDFHVGIFSEEEELDKLLFTLGCQNNLLESFSKIKEKLPVKYFGAIKSIVSLPETEEFENVKMSLLENKQTISASQLESYFVCPFRHFLQYVLKIKPKEDVLPNRKTFGIFQHALLKKFVSENENLGNLKPKEIEKFLNEHVEIVANKIYDESVLKNKFFVTYLKNESRFILKNIVKEQKFSSFKPMLFEEKIVVPFWNGMKLIGFVDRVDSSGDFFRIIDYKTGKTENVKKELYYGKKLQLFLYADAIQQKTGLQPAGVYYFDCQTKYSKINKHQNLFNGLTLKIDEIVLKTDSRLADEDFKSDFIGMTRKKNVKAGDFSFKNGNAEPNLQKFIEYAKQVSFKALQEMSEGYAAVKPFKETCLTCQFISICRHCESDGFRKVLKEKPQKKDDE